MEATSLKELAGEAAQPASTPLARPARSDGQAEVDELLTSGAARSTREAARALRRDSVTRRALAAADVSALTISHLAVALTLAPQLAFDTRRLWLIAALPLWVLANKLLGLYDRDANLIHKSTVSELPRIVQSILLGTGMVFLIGPAIGIPLTRAGTIAFCLVAIVAMAGLRYGVRRVAQDRLPPERCLIVGSGPVASAVARKIGSHPEYGATVIGFADSSRASDGNHRHGRVFALERATDIEGICRRHEVERVILGFSSFSPEEQLELIQTSKLLDLKVSVVPRLFEMTGPAVEVDEVEGMTLLGLRGFARTRSSLFLKRAIDVTFASLGLIALLPLMATIALAIKLSSPGPVLYAQNRIGRNNRKFKLYKFRTMSDGADELKAQLADRNEARHPMFKIADDPRVTRLGRLLRRTSLDEIPQLWNVLRGEMSLVGPRPLVPSEDAHVVGWHRDRLRLTPGLTGPWQVMGRTAIPFDEMVKLDYLYVAEWSLWKDLELLLRTAPVVLLGRGH